jgi:hypothetical protein
MNHTTDSLIDDHQPSDLIRDAENTKHAGHPFGHPFGTRGWAFPVATRTLSCDVDLDEFS